MTARSSFAMSCLLGLLPIVAAAIGIRRLLITRENLTVPEPVAGLCQIAWNESLDTFGHVGSILAIVLLGLFALRMLNVAWAAMREARGLKKLAVLDPPLLLTDILYRLGETEPRVPEVRLVRGDRPMALTAGMLRPTIYMSSILVGMMSAAELEAVIRHEMVHVRRRDPLRVFIMQVLRAALPVVPILILLLQSFERRKEMEADAEVVAEMGGPAPLAGALLKLLSPILVKHSASAGASPTEDRIDSLLGYSQSNFKGQRVFQMAVLSAASLSAVTFVVLAVTSRPGLAVAHICVGV